MPSVETQVRLLSDSCWSAQAVEEYTFLTGLEFSLLTGVAPIGFYEREYRYCLSWSVLSIRSACSWSRA